MQKASDSGIPPIMLSVINDDNAVNGATLAKKIKDAKEMVMVT